MYCFCNEHNENTFDGDVSKEVLKLRLWHTNRHDSLIFNLELIAESELRNDFILVFMVH